MSTTLPSSATLSLLQEHALSRDGENGRTLEGPLLPFFLCVECTCGCKSWTWRQVGGAYAESPHCFRDTFALLAFSASACLDILEWEAHELDARDEADRFFDSVHFAEDSIGADLYDEKRFGDDR